MQKKNSENSHEVKFKALQKTYATTRIKNINFTVAEFTSKLDEAREDFEQNTCMRLVPRTSQERYISYYKGTYCSSPIGAGTNVVEVRKTKLFSLAVTKKTFVLALL